MSAHLCPRSWTPVISVQLNRYNSEMVALMQAAFGQWSRTLSIEGRRGHFHFISAGFDDLRDEGELRHFNKLPTSFELGAQAVDRLRAAPRMILRQSPDCQALRQKLNSLPDAP
jgi:hypothetical protein